MCIGEKERMKEEIEPIVGIDEAPTAIDEIASPKSVHAEATA